MATNAAKSDPSSPASTGGDHARRDAKGRWQRGGSGNAAGRPEGSRNKISVACDALMEGKATALTERAIGLALGGDVLLLRAFMDRLLPTRRGRPIFLDLPAVRCAADAPNAIGHLIQAVGEGRITVEEAEALGRTIGSFVVAHHAAITEERIARLEAATGLPR